MVHGGYVARNLRRIVARNTRRLAEFEQQEIGERRLGPLDPGRQHRLLADVGVHQERRLQALVRSLQPPKGETGGLQQPQKIAFQLQRRPRRQGRRDEGPYLLASGDSDLVATRHWTFHEDEPLPCEELGVNFYHRVRPIASLCRNSE